MPLPAKGRCLLWRSGGSIDSCAQCNHAIIEESDLRRYPHIEIVPAVDLRGGKCVRLYQGDYAQETVFSDDPVDAALRWQSMGAPRLHIVDLDGAATGKPANLDIASQIARTLLIATELGGGIRDVETIEQVLRAGIERIILGTAAIEDAELVKEACRRFKDATVVGIDARDGFVATRGWKLQTRVKAVDFARSMVDLGVKRIIYTDINRDGTLTEPNFTAIYEIVRAVTVPVVCAGGISSLMHLKMLKELGVEGVIVGKALYTGGINLKKALQVINR